MPGLREISPFAFRISPFAQFFAFGTLSPFAANGAKIMRKAKEWNFKFLSWQSNDLLVLPMILDPYFKVSLLPADKLEMYTDRMVAEILKLKGGPTLPSNTEFDTTIVNNPFSGLMTAVA